MWKLELLDLLHPKRVHVFSVVGWERTTQGHESCGKGDIANKIVVLFIEGQ